MFNMILILLALVALILAHEAGHFLVARLLGVKCEVFSFGFGKKLITKRIGETEYRLSLIPLGGYVQCLEYAGLTDPDRNRSLTSRPVWQRALIVAGGPFINLLIAYLLLVGVFIIGAPGTSTKIADVLPSAPAAKAGLQVGDQIIAVNGHPVKKFEELLQAISVSRTSFELSVLHGQQTKLIQVTPEIRGGKPFLGIRSVPDKVSVSSGLYSFVKAGKQIGITMKAFYSAFSKPKEIASNIGGPVAIVQAGAQQANAGIYGVIGFAIIISLNLMVFNLLPIAALDGGRLLFLGYEAIFRRAPSTLAIKVAHGFGAMAIAAILFLALFNDAIRLFLSLT